MLQGKKQSLREKQSFEEDIDCEEDRPMPLLRVKSTLSLNFSRGRSITISSVLLTLF